MIKSSVLTTFFKHFCIISWKSSATEFKYQQINYVIVTWEFSENFQTMLSAENL